MKILIDNGHGVNTKGKCSPDGRLREWSWTRACAVRLRDALCERGFEACLVTPEDADVDLPSRVERVNRVCKEEGAKNCLLVSLHVNASGNDGKWHDACGWSVFVSKNASENSKKLARMLTVDAMKRELMGNRSVPVQKYWTWSWTKNDLYLLKHTFCPAVLSENLFQDHKGDVDFLLSEDGMREIVDLHADGITKYISSLS